jgi:hypothetical protein
MISTVLIIYPAIISFLNRESAELPKGPQLKRALEYSKSGKNTLIFMLDMFTGTHIKQMMEEDHDTMAKFSGFTWYPDTVAAGNVTLFGFPAIMGGHSYLPSELNKDQNRTNTEKLTRAHSVLPEVFIKAGGFVALLNIPRYFDTTTFNEQLGGSSEHAQVVPNATDITYKQDMKTSESSLYSIAISLFRMAPNVLRASVYQDGGWLGAANTTENFRATKSEVAFLTALPALSSATSSKDTLKVVYSLLPHCFYHLKRGVVEFADDPEPSTPGQPYAAALRGEISLEHYYTEQHTMRFVGEYLDWLRAAQLYDNTKIILVSDHSWSDSRMLSDVFGGDHGYPGRPAGLLMVKDFNAAGPIRISQHYMSTADVPYLACSHLNVEACEPNEAVQAYLRHAATTDTPLDRERTHDIAAHWTIERHPERTLLSETYRIRNSMFDLNNWTRISN